MPSKLISAELWIAILNIIYGILLQTIFHEKFLKIVKSIPVLLAETFGPWGQQNWK